jgi:hypothetical protein
MKKDRYKNYSGFKAPSKERGGDSLADSLLLKLLISLSRLRHN